jgi:hypothetical protein
LGAASSESAVGFAFGRLWGRPRGSSPRPCSAVVRVRWWVWMVDVRFVCGIRVSL